MADHHPQARVVKAFNTIWFEHLATQGDPTKALDARRALPVASDNPEALAEVAALVEARGVAPLPIGTLDDHAALIEPGGALYNQDLTLAQARPRLAELTG